jgi:hypothetical protein
MMTGKFACDACVGLLKLELAARAHAAPGHCGICGAPNGRSWAITWSQANQILDARKLWRPRPGGDAMLVQPGGRGPSLAAQDRLGKYVHILDVADVGRLENDEPWFTVRIVGEEPPPASIYPAYPQSALAEYKLTNESLLEREATLKDNIRTMPTAEKLRLAADFLDRGLPDIQVANVIKRALLEVEGALPKVPMPEVPPC